jgi:hypothetical protein
MTFNKESSGFRMMMGHPARNGEYSASPILDE